jgi:hypothetical protein
MCSDACAGSSATACCGSTCAARAHRARDGSAHNRHRPPPEAGQETHHGDRQHPRL